MCVEVRGDQDITEGKGEKERREQGKVMLKARSMHKEMRDDKDRKETKERVDFRLPTTKAKRDRNAKDGNTNPQSLSPPFS